LAPKADIMVFRAVVVATFVALVSAGMDANYMNMMAQMMHGMMNGGGMQQGGGGGGGGQSGGGCDPSRPGGCQIPQGVDVGEYLKQQQEAQAYETQQMAEKMKAQFEQVMREVTMKKHRYAMSVMTEFTSMCACAQQSVTIYQTMFVESAKTLNLTDVVDLNQVNMEPQNAKSAKEARELIFAGMVKALCESLGSYMAFAQEVENNIPIFTNNVTPSGK